MGGFIIFYTVFIVFIAIGITAMVFTFKIDIKELTEKSWHYKVVWWYGVCFAVLIILWIFFAFSLNTLNQLNG